MFSISHTVLVFFQKSVFFWRRPLSPVHAQVYKTYSMLYALLYYVCTSYEILNSSRHICFHHQTNHRPLFECDVKCWANQRRERERRRKGKSIEALWPLERESPEGKFSLVESPPLCFLNRNSCYVHYALTLLQYCGTPNTASPIFKMGNTDTKLNFRKAVIQLTTKTSPVDAADEDFWEQFWSESVTSVQVKLMCCVVTWQLASISPSGEIKIILRKSISVIS